MTIAEMSLMTPSELTAYKDETKWHAHVVIQEYKRLMASLEIRTCFGCEDTGSGYGELPAHWMYIDDGGGYLLCDKCLKKWETRWVLPPLSRMINVLPEEGFGDGMEVATAYS